MNYQGTYFYAREVAGIIGNGISSNMIGRIANQLKNR